MNGYSQAARAKVGQALGLRRPLRPPLLICGFLLAVTMWGAQGFPQADETLNYTVNWPSGLSLGEGRLEAKKNAAGWEFDLQLDAAVPGAVFTSPTPDQILPAIQAADGGAGVLTGRFRGGSILRGCACL